MTEERTFEGRNIVHEEYEGSVVIEIYEKRTPEKRYYDYKSKHLYYIDDEERRTDFVQQRDMRSHIIALCRAQTWISDRHRELRKQSE